VILSQKADTCRLFKSGPGKGKTLETRVLALVQRLKKTDDRKPPHEFNYEWEKVSKAIDDSENL